MIMNHLTVVYSCAFQCPHGHVLKFACRSCSAHINPNHQFPQKEGIQLVFVFIDRELQTFKSTLWGEKSQVTFKPKENRVFNSASREGPHLFLPVSIMCMCFLHVLLGRILVCVTVCVPGTLLDHCHVLIMVLRGFYALVFLVHAVHSFIFKTLIEHGDARVTIKVSGEPFAVCG